MARALASASWRARSKETPSVLRKKPSCFASSALVATLASAMFLNTCATYSNVFAATPSGMFSSARQSMLSVPAPPGMRPTPTSTRPEYVSAAAWMPAAERQSSRPPPSVMP